MTLQGLTLSGLVLLTAFSAGCASYSDYGLKPCQVFTPGCKPPGGTVLIECNDWGQSGLIVPMDSPSIVVENFDVRNCRWGLTFTGGCRACNLTIRNGRITGGMNGPYLNEESAIYSNSGWNRVVLENVTIEVPVGYNGITLGNEPPELELSQVRITSGGFDPNTTGLNLWSGYGHDYSSAVIRNSTFQGFGIGAFALAEDVRLEHVRASQNGIGLGIVAHRIEALDLNASDNRQTGVYALPLKPRSGAFAFTGIEAARNEYGVRAEGIDVQVSNLNATDNQIGLWAAKPISRVTVRDSTFRNNALWGIQSEGAAIDASNNWWGDAAGPTIRVNDIRTPGKGDSTSPGVHFIPFRDSPP